MASPPANVINDNQELFNVNQAKSIYINKISQLVEYSQSPNLSASISPRSYLILLYADPKANKSIKGRCQWNSKKKLMIFTLHRNHMINPKSHQIHFNRSLLRTENQHVIHANERRFMLSCLKPKSLNLPKNVNIWRRSARTKIIKLKSKDRIFNKFEISSISSKNSLTNWKEPSMMENYQNSSKVR